MADGAKTWAEFVRLNRPSRRELIEEVSSFDITRFPDMEAKAIEASIDLGVDAVRLLEWCEIIFKAGVAEATGLMTVEADARATQAQETSNGG